MIFASALALSMVGLGYALRSIPVSTGYAVWVGLGVAGRVMLSLDAYNYGFFIGLVSFGVHLLLLGFLMVKSDHAPSVLGMLVALAGLGYVLINLARVVLPGYRDHEGILLLLLVVLGLPGEFGLVG